MLTVPTAFLREEGDEGKQRPHDSALSCEPRACSAQGAQLTASPQKGSARLRHPTGSFLPFAPKGAAGNPTFSPVSISLITHTEFSAINWVLVFY